ncbi:MAG: hypothetical protein ABS38_12730 [Acidovorax sp. SCN 68-22]|nr:MAG: hypothetical protein ABS38_12730 [Acidovorax sp. SCN 68-22]
MELVVNQWAAFAPRLNSQAQWRAWALQPWLPTEIVAPALPEMPALLRRRLDPLGRMAAQVVYWCQRERVDMPVVLASRYGDAVRSLEMLADLARGQALSPTAFGMSVHNAIGAMIAIARSDRANALAVAAGAASAAAALVEAVALLADGAPEVLVVCYDAPLPGAYADFADEVAVAWAWAWRIGRPSGNEAKFSLNWGAADGPADQADAGLPFGLDMLRAMLSGQALWQRAAEGRRWSWRRHG